jgi:hypothetical protein
VWARRALGHATNVTKWHRQTHDRTLFTSADSPDALKPLVSPARTDGPGAGIRVGHTFCSKNYGVTFLLLAKTDVNGSDRHPLYAELTKTPDTGGEAGDIQWNFEKFLVAPNGQVVNRFRPRTVPDAPEVIAAIEAVLPR